MTETWVPQACTLPTVEQPLRRAEFDELFAAARKVSRRDDTTLVLELEPTPETAAKAADLAMREIDCCSFFTFGLHLATDTVSLTIGVVPAQTAVLDAITERASTTRTP
jgi:hypothetical protein